MKVTTLLACAALPLMFCRCGGSDPDPATGDAKPKEATESTKKMDPIAAVKAASFPEVSTENDDLPPGVLEAAKGKTWG